jgi:hypothetical protein
MNKTCNLRASRIYKRGLRWHRESKLDSWPVPDMTHALQLEAWMRWTVTGKLGLQYFSLDLSNGHARAPDVSTEVASNHNPSWEADSLSDSQEMPAFNGTVFTTFRHFLITWARWIQSTPLYAASSTFILILSSYRQIFPKWAPPFRFSDPVLYIFKLACYVSRLHHRPWLDKYNYI